MNKYKNHTGACRMKLKHAKGKKSQRGHKKHIKPTRGKKHIAFRSRTIKMILSSHHIEVETKRKWNDIFNILKGKTN